MSLVVAVVFGVMAIGSVHVGSLFFVAACSVFSAVCAIRSDPSRTIVPVAWVCLALAGWSALQAIPIPMGTLRAIAPLNADVWSRALETAGEAAPTWASISLDPGASWRAACQWSTYGCVVIAASAVVHRRGQPWGAMLLFGSGIALALVTVMHGAFGLSKVWGVYRPEADVAPWHLGPLLNPNNLAGYLNLSFLAGLGLALSPRAGRRWANVLGLVVIASTAILSASRGGVVLLPLGVAVLAIVVWRWRRTRHPRRVLGVLAGALGGGVLLALLGGSTSGWTELLDGSMDKLSMVDWLSPMAADHPWVGIGRGAFESVSPAHQPLVGHVRFTHAEMFPLHWAIEWGAVVAGLALFAFGFLLRPGHLRSMSTTGIGVYIGIVVLLVQNLFDLALEIPGVMIALAAAVGTVSSSLASTSRRSRSKAASWRSPSTGFVAAAACALLLAIVLGRRDVQSDRQALRSRTEALVGTQVALGAFPQAIREAIRRHPAEPYFPLLAALVAFDRKHEPVMPWLQRALERGENDGRVHLLLAHLLGQHGVTHQALMELRLAVDRDPQLREPCAKLALRLTREPELLVRAVPDGEAGVGMLEALATRVKADPLADSTWLDEEILRRDPTAVEARVRLASRQVAELDRGDEGACADPRPCMDEIRAHIAKLDEIAPNKSAGARVMAKLEAAQRRHDEAARLLAERCDAVEDRRRCWRAVVEHASDGSETRTLATAGDKLLAMSCADRARCAATAEWLGKVHLRRGSDQAAMLYFQRAASEEATAERLLAFAKAARKAGSPNKARRALKRALSMSSTHQPEIKQQLQELQ